MTIQILSFSKAIAIIVFGVISLAIPVIPGFILIFVGIKLFQKQGQRLEATSPLYRPYQKLSSLCTYGSYITLETSKRMPLI